MAVLVSQDGRTPLYAAAIRGHLAVVERLIAARAMVDAANKVAPALATLLCARCPPRHINPSLGMEGGVWPAFAASLWLLLLPHRASAAYLCGGAAWR